MHPKLFPKSRNNLNPIKLSLKILFFSLYLSASQLTKLYANGAPFNGLKEYAKRVSIGIETPASSGSGFIIGKKNNEYFFITAGHVAVSDPQKEEYWVYSLVNEISKKYRVNKFIKPEEFKGKDIVIGSFSSKEALEIVPIFPLGKNLYTTFEKNPEKKYWTFEIVGSFNFREYDYDWGIQGPPIVAGISIPTKAITVPIFRYSIASMQSRAIGNQRGYEAIYSATSTVPGMSGGGVFGARVCPKFEYIEKSEGENPGGAYPGVIAMHGMSEEYSQSGSRSGTSLGIPLSLFTEFFYKNSSEFGIPNGGDYFELVYNLCVKRGMY